MTQVIPVHRMTIKGGKQRIGRPGIRTAGQVAPHGLAGELEKLRQAFLGAFAQNQDAMVEVVHLLDGCLAQFGHTQSGVQ